MQQYHDLMKRILSEGVKKTDRTGTGTISVFGHQMRFNLADGFPVVTTKKLHLRSIIIELLWFLRGDSNIKWLKENGCSIWDEWADENGDLGPVYGYQWRHWPDGKGGEIDQIKNLIHQIKTKPDSRRHLVSAWNVANVDEMALPPCHTLFQFYVAEGKLSCQLYQRSADTFLGVPFNIASYGMLLLMIAKEVNMIPDQLIGSLGDVHLYLNHIEQAEEQIEKEPFELPKMDVIESDILNGQFEYNLSDYQSHGQIKAPLSN